MVTFAVGHITVPFGLEQIFSARNTATAHFICKLATVNDTGDRRERADTADTDDAADTADAADGAEIGVAKERSHAFSVNFLDRVNRPRVILVS